MAFFLKKYFHGIFERNNAAYSISVGQYQKNDIGILSVLADKKFVFIGLYRYRPI